MLGELVLSWGIDPYTKSGKMEGGGGRNILLFVAI